MTKPEARPLSAAMQQIIEEARSSTLYCNWCGARPEQFHRPDCPASIAMEALDADEARTSAPEGLLRRVTDLANDAMYALLAGGPRPNAIDAATLIDEARTALATTVAGALDVEVLKASWRDAERRAGGSALTPYDVAAAYNARLSQDRPTPGEPTDG